MSATVTSPEKPRVRPGSSGYVGTSVLRVEDLRHLTGTSRFGDDVHLDGELHARMVRSEVAFGRLGEIDCSAARAMPGVIGVFTAADIPDVRIPVRLFPTEDAERALQAPLASGYVRYVGDPIAVVVAESAYLAEDAATEVLAEIEPLQAVLDPILACEPDAPVIHPDSLESNRMDPLVVQHGEKLEDLFAAADVVVSEELRMHRHGAVPMEPRALVSQYDVGSGRITVWGAAKVKHFNRRTLAALLEIEESAIRMVECDVGGGFGARGEFYPEDFLIPWLARELRRPVKWVEDRHENLVALNHSREGVWRVEAAAGADGTLLGFCAKAWFNQGAYVRTHGSVLLPNLMLNHLPGPYRWRGWEIESVCVLSNKTGAGTFRGPGQYEPTYVRERMIDLLAANLEADRAELRRMNLVRPGDMPYDSGVPDIDSQGEKNALYVDGDFPRTFDGLLSEFDYDGVRAEAERCRANGETVGIGVTCFIEMGNPGLFEQSRISPQPDGSFIAHVGIASLGQGIETALSQVAADMIGVPIERVRVSYRDTDLIPEGQGAFSSRGTVFGGNAILGAIRDMNERARDAAAERFGVDREQVVVDAGETRVEGHRAIAIHELGVEGEYRYEPGPGSHVLMGSNLALVRIDPETGGVEILRYGISYDVGKAINPLTLEGQVRGAAVQGIGGALFEEFSYGEDGQPLATSFMDYAMPTAAEVGPIDVLLLELGEHDPDDPMGGAQGGGEGGIIATAATLANAVGDAVGARGGELTALPITPELVRGLVASPVGAG
jgi:carbon-monoxide dehydrogenase large subunit